MSMKLESIKDKIANQETVRIKGVVDYSHIASKISGAALEKANSYTRFPSKDPYFKLSIQLTEQNITDAFIFDRNSESAATLAAYLASKVYQSKKDENVGKNFLSLTSKGSEIRTYQKGPDGKLRKVNLNGNELAAGVNVEIEASFFTTKFGAGTGLNAVIITDPTIKTYEAGFGVKGYEMAEEVIDLAPRKNFEADAVPADETAQAETPVGDAVADTDPVGTSTAPSNSSFDDLLAKFKAGGQ